MSKELDALELLKKNGFIDERTMNKLLLIEKALTPPIADEVCKALSEHMGNNIYYNESTKEFVQKMFHGNVLNRDEWFISYVTETYGDGLNTYTVNDYLPPHLITLIGRFYERVCEE